MRRLVPAALLALAAMGASPAEARFHRHAYSQHVAHSARAALGSTAPNFSAIVIDAHTGRTLYGVNEDAPRHPASITKVMTLYLLFEQMDKGRITLDTPLQVSAHAAGQSPTKLGVPAGGSVTVDTAIKAIVTRSANDMAVTVAENLAGDELSFARLMTEKARALGMRHTFYHNASGLPDMRQITTARDLTILGRAIHDRFPRYYKFFSTPSFVYRGEVINSHNHLMARMQGMDGIKTGYTNASGFNLLSSIQRGGRHVIAVVMGGKSAASRDNVMQGLLESHFEEAQAGPATHVAETGQIEEAAETPRHAVPEPPAVEREAPRRVELAQVQAQGDDDDTDDDDVRPAPVVRAPPRGPSLIAPEMAVPPPERPADRPRVAAAHADSSKAPSFPVRPAVMAASKPATVPPGLHWVVGAPPARVGQGAPDPKAPETKVPGRAQPITFSSAAEDRTGSTAEVHGHDRAETPREADASPVAKGEWVIQIGATDNAGAAADLLSRARSEGRSALASARPFTEKVQKGEATLYRARFAGLAPAEAEIACRTLKRSGFECFATRN